jgi:hypothetical protein
MTPQMRIPAPPDVHPSAHRGRHSAGVAVFSSGNAPHSRIVAPIQVAMASAGELVEVPLKKAVQFRPVATQPAEFHQPVAAHPPVSPGPIEPQKSQKAHSPSNLRSIRIGLATVERMLQALPQGTHTWTPY